MIILGLGFGVYEAFIKAGPGEWDSAALIEFGNNADFDNTVLDGDPKTVDLLGVKWKRQRATASFAGREGVLILDQNAEAGIALKVFQGGSVRLALAWTHYFRGCGAKNDFEGILEGYLKVFVEGFQSHETEESRKRKMKDICSLFETGKAQEFGAPCDAMFKEMTESIDKACENL